MPLLFRDNVERIEGADNKTVFTVSNKHSVDMHLIGRRMNYAKATPLMFWPLTAAAIIAITTRRWRIARRSYHELFPPF
jgi:hypothetical protein